MAVILHLPLFCIPTASAGHKNKCYFTIRIPVWDVVPLLLSWLSVTISLFHLFLPKTPLDHVTALLNSILPHCCYNCCYNMSFKRGLMAIWTHHFLVIVLYPSSVSLSPLFRALFTDSVTDFCCVLKHIPDNLPLGSILR